MWMEGTASDQDCGAADLARTFTAVVWPENGQGQERVRIQAATHDDAEVLLRATYGQGCEFDLTDVQAASRPRTGCDRHGLELPGPAPGGVTQVQEAMVRHLVDLESEFSPDRPVTTTLPSWCVSPWVSATTGQASACGGSSRVCPTGSYGRTCWPWSSNVDGPSRFGIGPAVCPGSCEVADREARGSGPVILGAGGWRVAWKGRLLLSTKWRVLSIL